MKILIPLSCCLLLIAQDGKLKIEQGSLALSEDGTPVPPDSQFLPGELIFFSARVSGFARQGEEPPKMFVSYQLETRDAKGVLLLPVETGKIANELSPEDKQWRPKIRATLALPPLAGSGRCTLALHVKDELNQAEANFTMPFDIKGREVAPSETLIVRNFRFLRGEEDREPLQTPAYRPGDALWARFDMTGYKLGEKNAYDIDYGLTVYRPSGGVALQEPHAAADKNESFYPQPYTPGILNFNIPKDMAKGRYRLVLTVHDNLGGQAYEAREEFSVE